MYFRFWRKSMLTAASLGLAVAGVGFGDSLLNVPNDGAVFAGAATILTTLVVAASALDRIWRN